jgi:hypothetical protein
MCRLAIAFVALTLCAYAQDRLRDKEAALGAQLATQVRNETTPIDLPEVEKYVEMFGSKLVPYVPGRPSMYCRYLFAPAQLCQ